MGILIGPYYLQKEARGYTVRKRSESGCTSEVIQHCSSKRAALTRVRKLNRGLT